MRRYFTYAMTVAVVLAAVGFCHAATVTLKLVRSRNSATTGLPNSTFDYRVNCGVSPADNRGLAAIAFDVETDTNRAQAALTVGPSDMDPFILNQGFSNQEGFGGTTVGDDIVGIGGAQNTIRNLGSNAPYPVRDPVVFGIGQSGEITIATGQITMPQTTGDYMVRLAKVVTAVVPTGATPPCAVQEVTPQMGAFESLPVAVRQILGDVNNDTYVNVGDLQALIAAWNKQWPEAYVGADCNGDGYVNVGDLQILVQHWGQQGQMMSGGSGESLTPMQVGQMGLSDSGNAISLKVVAVDPVTGQEVSAVQAPAGTQLVVRLYAHGPNSGILAVGGDIVATGEAGALNSTGQQFTWTVGGQQSGISGPNGGMTQLGWGQGLDFSLWDASFGRSAYVLLGTYTMTVQDAAKPVTLTWQECPLNEWGARSGYDGWYTTGTTYGDTQVGQIIPLTINGPTVSPGPVPSFVYETWPVSLGCTATSPQGYDLTYLWTQTGGEAAALSGADTSNASFTVPGLSLITDTPLTFNVAVSDGHDGNATAEVAVLAYIMGDITHDNYVNVDDMQALTAVWGSGPNYTGPEDLTRDGYVNIGDLQALNGSWGRSLGAVAVTLGTVPGFVYEGRLVNLTCTAASAYGYALSYSWTQTAGLPVTLAGADAADASFTVPTLAYAGDRPLKFSVTVSDGHGGSATANVTIQAWLMGDINHDNVVNASDVCSPSNPAADLNNDGVVDSADEALLAANQGRSLAPSLTVTTGEVPAFVYETWPVSLTCTATSARGYDLSYQWQQTWGPYVTLTGATTASAGLAVPTLEYIDDEWFGFTVTVSDGHGGSITSEEVWAEAFMMGDVNHDYAVDSSDTAAVTAAMGKHPGETGWDAAADLVNDQVINSADQDLVTVNMNRILDWYGSRIMDGSSTSEGASVRSQPDGPAIDHSFGPVDSDGLTFEQALQQVGLLDEWLEYQANQ